MMKEKGEKRKGGGSGERRNRVEKEGGESGEWKGKIGRERGERMERREREREKTCWEEQRGAGEKG